MRQTIKKAGAFAAALLLIFTLSLLPAFADDELILLDDVTAADADADAASPAETAAPDGAGASYNAELPRVIDNAGLLTDDEEANLAATVNEMIGRHNFDFVILTVNDTDGKDIMDFADDYYDYRGYGVGNDRDGIILVVDMGSRNMWMSTCGYGVTAFTDYGIGQVLDIAAEYLGTEDYFEAFDSFLLACDVMLDSAEQGEAVDTWIPDPDFDPDYDGVTRSEKSFSPVPIIVGVVIGLIVAGMVTGSMKSKMKTSVLKNEADDYMRRDTFDLMVSEDTFLYSNTVATPRSTDSGSRSSGGHSGGSSTHTSSSGSTHGGGGRSF